MKSVVRLVQFHPQKVRRRQQPAETAHGVIRRNLAVIDNHDPVAEAFRLLHVVRGVEQGLAALLQRFQVLEDGVAALRIDPHRGLVQQQ